MGSIVIKLCGIDEAGRGPLCGPLVVSGVVLHKNIDALDDSKKLSSKKREILFEKIIQNSDYFISFSSNIDIDRYGLSFCINRSIREIQQNIQATRYLIDGNTTFKATNISCEIKADQKYAQVMAASILAKVSRDRYMIEQAKIYPKYNFDKHKGYPTKEHRQLIQLYGLTPIHRRTFKGCKS
ncbi:MAG: ribonuclease HII [Campylobacteraceae bacterium 4484_166]|nr:MAG: ribonuclease HII [Campylobacteraceae bacterium 4484_166]